MKTEFITLELRLAEAHGKWHDIKWHDIVEERLSLYGVPLRWAITQINQANQTATVEAVVTQTA
jgi:hypothetical protein